VGLATLTFVVGLSYRGLQDALEAAVALTVSATGRITGGCDSDASYVSRMARRHAYCSQPLKPLVPLSSVLIKPAL